MNTTETTSNILEALAGIDPATLDYTEWLNVGMALKAEGYTVDVWDDWSRNDRRYHPGECEKKWSGFDGTGITGGTLVKLAKDQGWQPEDQTTALSWDSIIGEHEDGHIIDLHYIEEQDLPSLYQDWHPGQQLKRYLELLFKASENVGYVCETYYSEDKQKYFPKAGSCSRTAGELIEALAKYGDDIGAVLGDYNKESGAWIRFNPLDGQGVKNANVTDFRYALVESDCMSLEQQYALIKQLELPAVILVHSGGKSLHAIVRIGASTYDEYRKRVDYLYTVCEKNGLKLDSQNRNPSRLSRMPGVERNGKRQYIVDENIGKHSFEEWQEWVEAANDSLPDMQELGDVWDNLPPLAPPLIDGILRQGHKLLLSGASKAGKSFALIELCIAIAEGRSWFGAHCAQGKVLYINLELDPASCLHRFADVYKALGWEAENRNNITIWHLRGSTVPMDKLVPKLLRRCHDKGYIAIVFDPIYKIITGDENSASDMALFCNQFDKVAKELGCATIYCHHHSKGSQGGKKAMDRASGSGVFARDPDALLDLLELDVPASMRDLMENDAGCAVCARWLDQTGTAWRNYVAPGTDHSLPQIMYAAESRLKPEQYTQMSAEVDAAKRQARLKSAWRVECTLREFPRFEPRNLWFDYPLHVLDESGELAQCKPDGGSVPPVSGILAAARRHQPDAPKDKKQALKESVRKAYNFVSLGGSLVTVQAIAEYMNVTERTARTRINASGEYSVYENTVTENPEHSES